MSTNSQNEVIELKDVTKIYRDNSQESIGVKDISLSAKLGELLLILGPSGSGKTTLLLLMAGLIELSSGDIKILGKDISEYSSKELQRLRVNHLGFIFQNFLLIDSLTVLENICLNLKFAGRSHKTSKEIAHGFLDKFNTNYLANKFPNSLSHGEKQRVAIIRALCNSADIILADEPTASLESKQGFQIIELLHDLAKDENKCVIVVSHDLRIQQYADRVIKIEDSIID